MLRNNNIFDIAGNKIDPIDSVREMRNELVKGLLNDERLKNYLIDKYNLTDISKIKLEFIKRSLQALLISPIDLEHYGRLILDIRRGADSQTLVGHHYLLFLDVERTIKNYIY